MARIRSAKPEFWTDPLMTALSRDVRFTFKGLFEVCADDFGFFLGDVRLVKSQVWPLDDDLTLRKIEGFLQKLHELGRIKLYEVDGIRYGQIINWHKHQRVDHPTPSRIPREHVANSSRAIPEPFASVSRPRARRGDRIGEERIGKEADSGKERGASDEPGSAAALVAPLPNCEPTYAGIDLDAINERMADAMADAPNWSAPIPPDAKGGVLTEEHVRVAITGETPAHSPNGTPIVENAYGIAGDMPAATVKQVTVDLELPMAAVKFGRTFYPRGTATDARRQDVFDQLLRVLGPAGLPFNGGVIHATPARLSSACLAVLKTHAQTPLEDTDSALPYLLVKLSDVSQDSPTEKAAVESKVEEIKDRETFAERKARADKIAAVHPEEAAKIEEAAVKVFPGKAKEMAQPRESFRVSRLLQLEEVAT